jgi:hypothetical protein
LFLRSETPFDDSVVVVLQYRSKSREKGNDVERGGVLSLFHQQAIGNFIEDRKKAKKSEIKQHTFNFEL